jgi:hypothetical protein
MDHAAGVRQVLAETGATLVVGFDIRDFWEKKGLLAPSTSGCSAFAVLGN